jgi:hypothetical protein
MYQIAASIWNRIAKDGELNSAFAKRLFSLNQEELNAALADEELSLIAAGVQSNVVVAFLTVAPLLWESRAILKFVQDSPMYRDVFPMLCDAREAVVLATLEFRLDANQQEHLQDLLGGRDGIFHDPVLGPRGKSDVCPSIAKTSLVLSRKDLVHALKTLGAIRKRRGRGARVIPVWLRFDSKNHVLSVGEDRHPARAKVQATGDWPAAGATVSMFTLRSAAEASQNETIELFAVEDAIRVDTPKGHVLLNLMPFGPESRRATKN